MLGKHLKGLKYDGLGVSAFKSYHMTFLLANVQKYLYLLQRTDKISVPDVESAERVTTSGLGLSSFCTRPLFPSRHLHLLM